MTYAHNDTVVSFAINNLIIKTNNLYYINYCK